MSADVPDLAALIRSVFASTPKDDDRRRAALARLDGAESLAAQLHDRADQLVGYFLEHARLEGASWTDLGRRLGVSRQAAQQRYSSLQERITMNELINAAPGILPPRAQAALRRASEKAKAAGQPAVQPQHILLGILAGPGVAADALASLGVPADTLAAEVESTLPAGGRQPVEGEVPVSEATRLLFQRALTESQRLMHNYIGTEHLLLALSADDTVGKALAARGASGDQLRAAVQAEFKKLGLDKRVPGPA